MGLGNLHFNKYRRAFVFQGFSSPLQFFLLSGLFSWHLPLVRSRFRTPKPSLAALNPCSCLPNPLDPVNSRTLLPSPLWPCQCLGHKEIQFTVPISVTPSEHTFILSVEARAGHGRHCLEVSVPFLVWFLCCLWSRPVQSLWLGKHVMFWVSGL